MERKESVWLKYHASDAGWKEYPESSIYAFLKQTAERYPAFTAIEFEGKKTSFKNLLAQIDQTARGFQHLGVSKGDCVTIISPNTPQALIAVYAVNRLGAIANILHPLLSAAEIQRFTEDVNSSAVLILDMIYPKIAKIQWKDSFSPKIVLFNIAQALPRYKQPFFLIKNHKKTVFNPKHDITLWSDMLKHGKTEHLVPEAGKADDTAVILYSGGTTGTPKGVVITNGNLNCLAVQSHDVYERDDIAGTHSLALMPIFHGFGFGVCMHGMLCNALHVFLLPKYDMAACTKLIFKRKISFLFGVPALYEALSRSVEIETKDLSFIQFIVTAGDRTPLSLMEKMNRQLKRGGSSAVMREAYGQTECTSGCCINPFFAIKPGSVGIPYTDMQMKIVECGTHESLPAGEIGEICISGPTVMKEYLGHPDETKQALQVHEDGKVWLHTGDLGYRDEDGYFYFSQRQSRMIITSGYNVYPTQLEAAIQKEPAVKACCVVGISDSVVGQKIRAYLVLNNPDADQNAVKASVIDCCKAAVAEYAIPHEFVFLQELPVSSLGKVDIKALVQMSNEVKII